MKFSREHLGFLNMLGSETVYVVVPFVCVTWKDVCFHSLWWRK